jgi:4-hydroxythreonine-4-phosphate dehydrogenase
MVESEDKKPNLPIRIGITHGDLNGIGYEIIIKAFEDNRVLENMTPIVYGSSKVASYHRKILNYNDFNFNLVKNTASAIPKRVNIVNITNQEVKIELGNSTQVAGEMAFQALEQAVGDLKENQVDVLVTAPINKKNMHSANFKFPGHTEYLAKSFGVENHLMLMVYGRLRIGVITGHIPIRDVSSAITTELITKKMDVLHHSLRRDFNIQKPKIAVLGLNPHAGDGGIIGEEDIEVILPAIEQAKNRGMLVYGPYPADGFFGSKNFSKFDGILAMYHDQGMIPFKAFSFDNGVNFTAGLPYVRTSPAHGTAYDIAGKNEASANSFREAIYLAMEIFENRQLFDELNANPIPNYLKEIETRSDAVIEKEIPEQNDQDGPITGNTSAD